MLDELNLDEKNALRQLFEKVDLARALRHALTIEANSWRQRLMNEALNPSSDDPVARLLKQGDYAARAHALETTLTTIEKKAMRE